MQPEPNLRFSVEDNSSDLEGWVEAPMLAWDEPLEAQIPIYWVPVLKSLYEFILPITQGPTIWVPPLPSESLEFGSSFFDVGYPFRSPRVLAAQVATVDGRSISLSSLSP